MTTNASYSSLTLEYVCKRFLLTVQMHTLFATIEPVAPSEVLLATLKRCTGLALTSEKARSEFLVAPVLLELRDYLCASTNPSININIYSGISFDIAPEDGLQGVCDFIVSKSSTPLPILQAPVVMLVEAKKHDLDAGLGQCIGEMLAAQKFNTDGGWGINTVYGCVTSGELWQFLRLESDIVSIEPKRLFIDSTDKILGMLVKILLCY